LSLSLQRQTLIARANSERNRISRRKRNRRGNTAAADLHLGRLMVGACSSDEVVAEQIGPESFLCADMALRMGTCRESVIGV